MQIREIWKTSRKNHSQCVCMVYDPKMPLWTCTITLPLQACRRTYSYCKTHAKCKKDISIASVFGFCRNVVVQIIHKWKPTYIPFLPYSDSKSPLILHTGPIMCVCIYVIGYISGLVSDFHFAWFSALLYHARLWVPPKEEEKERVFILRARSRTRSRTGSRTGPWRFLHLTDHASSSV